MNDNRRDFIKKSASLAAAVSLGGISSACTSQGDQQKNTQKKIARPYVKDGVIKMAWALGPNTAKVPFAKQCGVNYAVSGLLGSS